MVKASSESISASLVFHEATSWSFSSSVSISRWNESDLRENDRVSS